jgi:hypothetical protein
MKAIRLTANRNPAQNFRMVEVSKPNSRLLGVAGRKCLFSILSTSGSVG